MTLEFFSNPPREFDPPGDFHRVGYLFLARKRRTWQEFQANVRLQREHGVPVDLLNPAEIAGRWPFLHTEDLRGGTYCAEDGYADPYSWAMAFAKTSRRLGVRIEENTPVLSIRTEGGRVQGVLTPQGSLWAPIVINAAGPWAGEVAAMAGLRIPVKPFRRQVYVTRRFGLLPDSIPLIIDQDTLFYFRREGGGVMLGMTDADEPSSFHTHVDRAFLERLIETATQRAPALAQAEILRGWGGLYAITPDENPIIGRLGDLEGFWGAVGFSGHGFQHGPAVGRILSDLILRGQTDFDCSPFVYDRFSGPLGPGEQRTV
jgi:sarcosine oxidase subunit beta